MLTLISGVAFAASTGATAGAVPPPPCYGAPVFLDCSDPMGPWPSDALLSFTAECDFGVSAGGFTVHSALGEVMDVEVKPAETSCWGNPVWVLSEPLPPGSYEVWSDSFWLFWVDVEGPVAPLACAEDAECGPCGLCDDGVCLEDAAPAECESNADCPDDWKCVLEPGAPKCTAVCEEPKDPCKDAVSECLTHDDCGLGGWCAPNPDLPCVNICTNEQPCEYDSDCGPCLVCDDGYCQGLGEVECVSDSDCGPGWTCEPSDAGMCHNECVPQCEHHSQCGDCEACVDGACVADLEAKCIEDEDCGAYGTCVIHDAVCLNYCVYETPPDCTSDAECGGCEICTNGACVPSPGVAECLSHEDCGSDQACIVDPDNACDQICVELETADGDDNTEFVGGEPTRRPIDGKLIGCAGQANPWLGLAATLMLGLLVLARRRPAVRAVNPKRRGPSHL